VIKWCYQRTTGVLIYPGTLAVSQSFASFWRVHSWVTKVPSQEIMYNLNCQMNLIALATFHASLLCPTRSQQQQQPLSLHQLAQPGPKSLRTVREWLLIVLLDECTPGRGWQYLFIGRLGIWRRPLVTWWRILDTSDAGYMLDSLLVLFCFCHLI